MTRALIFPGQGAQIVGMGRDLVEVSTHAADVFKRADDVLGFDLSNVCFEGPAERLAQTDIQQPAILVTSVAFWAALTENGCRPFECYATAGLSLGEYTALHVAGALGFEDAVQLVYRRGSYMQEAAEAAPSGMVSILGLDEAAVEELCVQAAEGGVLSPANFNCPGQIVVSGDRDACGRIVSLVESGQGKAVPLKVAGAFHSPLMQPAAERLQADLAQVEFGPLTVPVLSNVDAAPHTDAAGIRDALYRQVCSPVRWQGCVQRMIADGIEEFIEIGPGRALTGMMRKIDRGRKAHSVNSAAAVQDMGETLAQGANS
jgi:[acyl-carrier-protein] S-malonyltransferase